MKVTALARPAGKWWAIEIPDINDGGIFAQARHFEEVAAMAAVSDVPEPHPAHVDRHLVLGLIGRVGLFVRVIVLFAEHAGRGHDLSIGAEDDLIDLVPDIDLAWHSGGRSVLSERQEDERPVGCAGSEQVTAR